MKPVVNWVKAHWMIVACAAVILIVLPAGYVGSMLWNDSIKTAREREGKAKLDEVFAENKQLKQRLSSAETERDREKHKLQRTVDAAHDVARLLAGLDEEDRALVLMKFAEGHEYDELAEMFGTSAGALRMRVARIRERLAGG